MQCPSCGSARVIPSRPSGWGESFLRSWSQTRYHECKDCHWRARLPRVARDGDAKRVDIRFWVAAALVGLGLLYVLVRVG